MIWQYIIRNGVNGFYILLEEKNARRKEDNGKKNLPDALFHRTEKH